MFGVVNTFGTVISMLNGHVNTFNKVGLKK